MAGREVAGLLPENAYTTVATVLDRLVHKGLVQRKMEVGSSSSLPSEHLALTPPYSCTRP